jgi:hypothetical protein
MEKNPGSWWGGKENADDNWGGVREEALAQEAS